jgi:hypothetical protein
VCVGLELGWYEIEKKRREKAHDYYNQQDTHNLPMKRLKTLISAIYPKRNPKLVPMLSAKLRRIM